MNCDSVNQMSQEEFINEVNFTLNQMQARINRSKEIIDRAQESRKKFIEKYGTIEERLAKLDARRKETEQKMNQFRIRREAIEEQLSQFED